ncbi:MAG: hypothetical protein GY786_02755 [Proteobacteria bacterium]|nr:hypothetical protein [Pseudomonadota bacterium]
MSETRKDAEEAFDLFIELYQLKYSKAGKCHSKDREVLLDCYDFPAQFRQGPNRVRKRY